MYLGLHTLTENVLILRMFFQVVTIEKNIGINEKSAYGMF